MVGFLSGQRAGQDSEGSLLMTNPATLHLVPEGTRHRLPVPPLDLPPPEHQPWFVALKLTTNDSATMATVATTRGAVLP